MGHKGWTLGSAILLGAVVFLAEPAVGYAQEGATTETMRGGRGPRGGRGGGFGIHRIALELPGITAEQKAKIEKLQAETRTKMQEARAKSGAQGGGPGSWNTPEMQKVMTEARAEVEAVLTEEQKKELAAKLAEQRSRWGGRQTTGTAEKQ